MPTLDEGGDIELRPDLSWVGGRRLRVRRRRQVQAHRREPAPPTPTSTRHLPTPRLVDLPGALLAYAEGEADSAHL